MWQACFQAMSPAGLAIEAVTSEGDRLLIVARSTSLIPQPSALIAKSITPPEFYSAATGQPGRFNEEFSLRRVQPPELCLTGTLLKSHAVPSHRCAPPPIAIRRISHRKLAEESG